MNGQPAGADSTAATKDKAAGDTSSGEPTAMLQKNATALDQDCAKKEGELRVLKDAMEKADEDKHEAYKRDIQKKEEEIAKIASLIRETKNEIKEHYKQAASVAADKEAEASQRMYEIMRSRAQEAGELAGVVQELIDLKMCNNDLKRAFKGIELAIGILGRVKTTFTMVLAFWKGVHAHCKDLADIDQIKEKLDPEMADSRDEWLLVVGDSLSSWACLGHICNLAHQAVEESLGSVNEKMRNLPTQEEANKLLNSNMGPLLQRMNAEADETNLYLMKP